VPGIAARYCHALAAVCRLRFSRSATHAAPMRKRCLRYVAALRRQAAAMFVERARYHADIDATVCARYVV